MSATKRKVAVKDEVEEEKFEVPSTASYKKRNNKLADKVQVKTELAMIKGTVTPIVQDVL